MTPLQTYVLLRCELEATRARIGNDSPESDAVRDQMDRPWNEMSERDRGLAVGFSLTLNSFNIPEPTDA